VEIRRSSARFLEKGQGRATRHAFSFGSVYDPDRVGFGAMVCHDDHVMASGRGFEEHPHADLDIVSFVVSGAVRHSDSLGSESELGPGMVGHLAAGSGVTHSEIAAAPQTRMVQVWLLPGEYGAAPAYRVLDPEPGPLVEALTVPSGTLFVSTLAAGESVTLPDGRLRHCFVASGALLRNSLAEPLEDGDALLLSEAGEASLTAAVPTRLLTWVLDR
jgi:redox-sensitive bicupin YhaK (pirin superfamily)